MKQMNYLFRILFIAAGLFSLSSCDSFLDELPDNRAELNTSEKIYKLLVSAYPDRCYTRMSEIASDNCDDMGVANPNTSLFLEQNSYWDDMTPMENESNRNTWQQYYNAISMANNALVAIEDLGTPDDLLPAKGEALMCRAYCHLCLTMLYCLPYHPEKAKDYMGIPYMDAPETELNPRYTRGNLEDVYQKINRDIEEGLPLIDDNAYSVPKYHFNREASLALATRFNLYYMKWDKVVEYATELLGSDPSLMMRDWKAVSKLQWDSGVRHRDYIDPQHRFNLLMMPLFSNNCGLFHAWDGSGARFAHNFRVAKCETYRSKRPMGGPYDRWKSISTDRVYHHPPFTWSSNVCNKMYQPKWPSQWQILDPVTGVGYGRTTMVAFTTNEALLSRAEAYIHLKNYDAAINDMNIWSASMFKVGENDIVPLTRELINEVYGDPESTKYIAPYTTETPTSRKELNPHGFTVEDGEQEMMIQCVLFCRRIETIGDGLRWSDVKRYGIVVDRFDCTNYIDDTTTGYAVSATLDERDLKRAFQIPAEIIAAGLEPNPRNEDTPTHPFRQ